MNQHLKRDDKIVKSEDMLQKSMPTITTFATLSLKYALSSVLSVTSIILIMIVSWLCDAANMSSAPLEDEHPIFFSRG